MSTILDKAMTFGYSNSYSTMKPQHLYLAYLKLHMENPCLHPDDYLSPDGGYEGYMVLLVNEVWRKAPSIPDTFLYPTSFLKLEEVLMDIEDMSTDLCDDYIDKPIEYDIECNMLSYINTVTFWLEDMKATELEEVIDCLQKLYLHHANDTDSEEEEAEKPAGVLKECADMLNWVLQQH